MIVVHWYATSVPARSWLVALAVALACVGTRLAASAESWRIDEAHTSIGFKIDAVGFPTTEGRFARYAGRIHLDFEHPAKGLTIFTVDSSSLDVGSPTFNDFVKSAALLNVAKYPTLGFASTQIEKLSARTARVTGNLTMLGVTRPITLAVSVDAAPSTWGRSVALSATGTIRRSDFGMSFGLPLISDTLELSVKTNALTDG